MTTNAPSIDPRATLNAAGAAPPAGGASAGPVGDEVAAAEAALPVGVLVMEPDAREEVTVVKFAPDE